MLRTFIQVSALILTLEAAIFLGRGNLGLSAEVIAELASTKISYNSDVVRNLASQRADTWTGVVLLLVAFLLQMWNSVWPMTLDELGDVNRKGVFAAVVAGILIFGASLFISDKIAQSANAKAQAILERMNK